MKVTVTRRSELTPDEVADLIRAHLKLPPTAKVRFQVEHVYSEPPEFGDRGGYGLTKVVVETEVVEDSATGKPLPDMDHCPECGGPYESRCRCPRSDSACAKGHHWHWGDDGTIHTGKSDHKGGNPCCGMGPLKSGTRGVDSPAQIGRALGLQGTDEGGQ